MANDSDGFTAKFLALIDEPASPAIGADLPEGYQPMRLDGPGWGDDGNTALSENVENADAPASDDASSTDAESEPEQGETFYHITSNLDRLLAEGARAEMVGAGAGIQAGRGFYLSRRDDLGFWGKRVSGWTVEVALGASVRLLHRNSLDQAAWEAWMVEQGFIAVEAGQYTFLPAIEGATGLSMEHVRRDPIAAMTFESILIGLYATAQGYDGVDYDDQIVITNFDLLAARAFRAGVQHDIMEEMRP